MDDRVLKAFDKTIEVIKDRAETKEVEDGIEALLDKRYKLVYHLQREEFDDAEEIIDELIQLAKKVHLNIKITVTEKKEEPKPSFIDAIFGGKKKEKSKLPKTKPKETKQKNKVVTKKEKPVKKKSVSKRTKRKIVSSAKPTISGDYAKEIKSLRKDLAKRDLELDGVIGAYSKLSKGMKDLREKYDKKEVEDMTSMKAMVQETKNQIESLHTLMDSEFGKSKESYQDFWFELIHVAIKVSELEEKLENEGELKDFDVFDFKENMRALQHQLLIVEANQKKNRLDLLEEIKRAQINIFDKTSSKNDLQKFSKEIISMLDSFKERMKKNNEKVASTMNASLKEQYVKLDEEMTDLSKKVSSSRKKNLDEVNSLVTKITKRVASIEEEEYAMEKELDQQRDVDSGLFAKLRVIDNSLRKARENNETVNREIYSAINALEAESEFEDDEVKKEVKRKLMNLKARVTLLENRHGVKRFKKKKSTKKKIVKKKLVKKKTTKKKKPAKKKPVKKKKKATKKKTSTKKKKGSKK